MNLMDKNKDQGLTRLWSRSQIVKSMENPVLLHCSRHVCRFLRRKIIEVKVKVT